MAQTGLPAAVRLNLDTSLPNTRLAALLGKRILLLRKERAARGPGKEEIQHWTSTSVTPPAPTDGPTQSLFHACLPTHDHIRFDHFTRPFQIDSCLLHVKADSVDFVAGRLGKTFPGDMTWVSLAGDPQASLGDDPTVAGPLRYPKYIFPRVAVADNVLGLIIGISPGDDDVVFGLDFVKGHFASPFVSSVIVDKTGKT